MAEQTAELRPFHETIVELINRAHRAEQLECLGELILTTKIPKNHDEIIAAWEKRRELFGWDEKYLGVVDSLLEQKQASAEAEKPDSKKKGNEA